MRNDMPLPKPRVIRSLDYVADRNAYVALLIAVLALLVGCTALVLSVGMMEGYW